MNQNSQRMKKLLSTFLISAFGAVTALVIYNFYIDHSSESKEIIDDKMVNISYSPYNNTSSKNIDFVDAKKLEFNRIKAIENYSLKKGYD